MIDAVTFDKYIDETFDNYSYVTFDKYISTEWLMRRRGETGTKFSFPLSIWRQHHLFPFSLCFQNNIEIKGQLGNVSINTSKILLLRVLILRGAIGFCNWLQRNKKQWKRKGAAKSRATRQNCWNFRYSRLFLLLKRWNRKSSYIRGFWFAMFRIDTNLEVPNAIPKIVDWETRLASKWILSFRRFWFWRAGEELLIALKLCCQCVLLCVSYKCVGVYLGVCVFCFCFWCVYLGVYGLGVSGLKFWWRGRMVMRGFLEARTGIA